MRGQPSRELLALRADEVSAAPLRICKKSKSDHPCTCLQVEHLDGTFSDVHIDRTPFGTLLTVVPPRPYEACSTWLAQAGCCRCYRGSCTHVQAAFATDLNAIDQTLSNVEVAVQTSRIGTFTRSNAVGLGYCATRTHRGIRIEHDAMQEEITLIESANDWSCTRCAHPACALRELARWQAKQTTLGLLDVLTPLAPWSKPVDFGAESWVRAGSFSREDVRAWGWTSFLGVDGTDLRLKASVNFDDLGNFESVKFGVDAMPTFGEGVQHWAAPVGEDVLLTPKGCRACAKRKCPHTRAIALMAPEFLAGNRDQTLVSLQARFAPNCPGTTHSDYAQIISALAGYEDACAACYTPLSSHVNRREVIKVVVSQLP